MYIMASRTLTLYVGVTNNIWRRVWEHKNKSSPGFTASYNINRLVYYESFTDVVEAIAREKKVKSWRRDKKIALICSANPHMLDLSSGWYDR